jgi:hypothetical protein
MSELILPRHICNAQMSKPVVFWFSKKLSHMMCPASPLAPAPAGYERIECRHAHEVDLWSNRLRAQEKRIREMTDEERYNFEEPIRAHMLSELRANLQKATDPVNREFLARSIEMIERKREQRRKEFVETAMHCEREEGVAS